MGRVILASSASALNVREWSFVAVQWYRGLSFRSRHLPNSLTGNLEFPVRLNFHRLSVPFMRAHSSSHESAFRWGPP